MTLMMTLMMINPHTNHPKKQKKTKNSPEFLVWRQKLMPLTPYWIGVHPYSFNMRTITASYISYIAFRIPDSIKLLSVEENDKVKTKDVPFSWYIRWSTLYYLDQDGNEHTIEPDDEPSTNWKHPDRIEEDEEDEE